MPEDCEGCLFDHTTRQAMCMQMPHEQCESCRVTALHQFASCKSTCRPGAASQSCPHCLTNGALEVEPVLLCSGAETAPDFVLQRLKTVTAAHAKCTLECQRALRRLRSAWTNCTSGLGATAASNRNKSQQHQRANSKPDDDSRPPPDNSTCARVMVQEEPLFQAAGPCLLGPDTVSCLYGKAMLAATTN